MPTEAVTGRKSRSDCGIPMADTAILPNSYDNVKWQPKTSPEVENLLPQPHSSVLHTMAFCCLFFIVIRLLKVLVKQKITCALMALMLPLWTVGHTYEWGISTMPSDFIAVGLVPMSKMLGPCRVLQLIQLSALFILYPLIKGAWATIYLSFTVLIVPDIPHKPVL